MPIEENAPLSYVGMFDVRRGYSLGNVLSVGTDWYELIGYPQRRARSGGGSFVCHTAVPSPPNYHDEFAIPGEVSRQQRNPNGAWDEALPTPLHTAFASLFNDTVAGPPGRGVNWRGVWASGLSYDVNDLVSWNFAVWIATQPVPAADITAPDAVGGSPKWFPFIPRTTPNFRGDWNASNPYNTGDLVNFDASGSSNLYSLTKDTLSGPFTSRTSPDKDTGNWALIMTFSDPSAAAWLAGAATLATVPLSITALVTKLSPADKAAAAAKLAQDMNRAVEASAPFRDFKSKIDAHTMVLKSIAEDLRRIP